jgi:hypothetical protein
VTTTVFVMLAVWIVLGALLSLDIHRRERRKLDTEQRLLEAQWQEHQERRGWIR